MRNKRNKSVKIPWTKIVWSLNLGLFSFQMFSKWLREDPFLSALLGIKRRNKY
ncbi:MAG TPA: hypothetical protein PKG52_07875 [bacterium]|nr:hypothetical protein [bacterium]